MNFKINKMFGYIWEIILWKLIIGHPIHFMFSIFINKHKKKILNWIIILHVFLTLNLLKKVFMFTSANFACVISIIIIQMIPSLQMFNKHNNLF